ncbi:MAG: hypothetical protein FJ146_07640 [Deltaproteobacteria bacterium]|nr:hypothetical protein [Deltaproteobacteria bacterium]
MAGRSTDNLDDLPAGEPSSSPTGTQVATSAVPLRPAPVPIIEMNYPDPTLLSVVLRDVSKWSGYNFVMEPSLNTKIQIFAPRRMLFNEAYDLFLASLAVVNLRAVQLGNVVKVVPVTLILAV